MSETQPWLTEPDHLEFTEHGLSCCINRGAELSHLCGYVAVPTFHPWHGKAYASLVPMKGLPVAVETRYVDHRTSWISLLCQERKDLKRAMVSIDLALSVHGGITYTGDVAGGQEQSDGQWWFGFDCAHAGDYNPSLALLGFHHADEVYRDLDYVRAECKHLAGQLAAIGAKP